MIFKDLKLGQHFHSNGTEYIKQSSRTARLVESPSIWFYFSVTETINTKKA